MLRILRSDEDELRICDSDNFMYVCLFFWVKVDILSGPREQLFLKFKIRKAILLSVNGFRVIQGIDQIIYFLQNKIKLFFTSGIYYYSISPY